MSNQVCNTVMIPVEEYEALRRQGQGDASEIEHLKGSVEVLRKQVEELTQVASAKEPFVLDLVRQRDAYRSVAEGEPLDAYQAVQEQLAVMTRERDYYRRSSEVFEHPHGTLQALQAQLAAAQADNARLREANSSK